MKMGERSFEESRQDHTGAAALGAILWWKFSKYPSMTQLPQAWHPARATTPLRKRKGETPPNYKTTPTSPRFEFLREPSRKSILSFLGVGGGRGAEFGWRFK